MNQRTIVIGIFNQEIITQFLIAIVQQAPKNKSMKKLLLITAIICCGCVLAHSQNTRLNIYGNYAFDDHVNDYYNSTNYFDGKVKGGFFWGG